MKTLTQIKGQYKHPVQLRNMSVPGAASLPAQISNVAEYVRQGDSDWPRIRQTLEQSTLELRQELEELHKLLAAQQQAIATMGAQIAAL